MKDFAAAGETDLLEAAFQGDTEAFAHLFERYRGALQTLCFRRLGDSSMAEDAVQEIFIKAFRNLRKFDRSKPFWPWLATIALRTCIDLQRQRSRFPTEHPGNIGVAEAVETSGEPQLILDAMIDRAQLSEALRDLPKRQRRAFLLYALDGWSYAEIASAEGISIGAVKVLVVRARKRMRAWFQGGTPAVIVVPYAWLRRKVQRVEERIRVLLDIRGEGWSSICVQAACLGAAALTVVAAGRPDASLENRSSLRSGEANPSMTQFQRNPVAMLDLAIRTSSRSPNQTAPTGNDPQSDAGAEYLMKLVDPSENATPENGYIDSIVASPNYEQDHTILALGNDQLNLLFTSRDGGATWKASSSRLLLKSENLAITPSYPEDKRIFALGAEFPYGLQQSDDGGEIFRMVSPVVAGSYAISPLFGKGDSTILIGGQTLLEYDAATGITIPASPSISLSYFGNYSSIHFSPSYSSDRTVFVSDGFANRDALGTNPGQNILYRCKGLVCEQTPFPFNARLTFRLSPRFGQDGVAYAFGQYPPKLLVSKDWGITFQDIPLPNRCCARDFAVLWSTSSRPTLFVYFLNEDFPVVYRSIDGGQTWSSSQIDVPYFHGPYDHRGKLVVTPTGRILAAGRGVVCSIDNGDTWARRCPPE